MASFDVTSSRTSIDDVLELIKKNQKDLPEDQRINVVEERKPVDYCNGCSRKKDGSGCKRCPHKKEEKQYDNFWDVEDDDGIYMCETCSSIRDGQYDPETCDQCTACENCTEYINGECDGCSFSIYRDGKYYRSKLDQEDLLDDEDKKLLDELNTEKEYDPYKDDEYDEFEDTFDFSVLNL